MRSTLSLRHLGFALASLFVVGCQNQISIDDPDCKEPEPEIPPGSWCPPAYECIDGEWVDTAGACPEPECPEAKPESGADCPLVGQECTYEEEVPCGPISEVSAVCTEAGWQVMTNYCQPEPVCPEELPVVGADCTGWYDAFWCLYPVQTACGEQFANVNCAATAEGAVWTLGSPLSCGACESYGAEADCGTDPSCQWLTPGCSGEPIVTGCYPVQGCDVTPCGENLTCVERSYNPCHNKLCDGCGGSYFTCVAE